MSQVIQLSTLTQVMGSESTLTQLRNRRCGVLVWALTLRSNPFSLRLFSHLQIGCDVPLPALAGPPGLRWAMDEKELVLKVMQNSLAFSILEGSWTL